MIPVLMIVIKERKKTHWGSENIFLIKNFNPHCRYMDSNDSVNPLWKKTTSIVKIYLVTLFIKGQKVSKEGIEVQEQKNIAFEIF